MKIISPFHDYYDTVLLHSQSNDIHFVRKTVIATSEEKDAPLYAERTFLFEGMPRERNASTPTGHLYLTPFRVAFCGKIYNGVEVQHWGEGTAREPALHEFFYEPAGLVRLIDEFGLRQDKRMNSLSGVKFGERFLEFMKSAPPQHFSFFAERREAITAARLARQGQRSIVINPALKSFGFVKVVNNWQAFQELEMFFGGLAAPENKPPVEIADKDRIAQRGFDRFSFRKPPTKRKSGG